MLLVKNPHFLRSVRAEMACDSLLINEIQADSYWVRATLTEGWIAKTTRKCVCVYVCAYFIDQIWIDT